MHSIPSYAEWRPQRHPFQGMKFRNWKTVAFLQQRLAVAANDRAAALI
jgi:hypothetical protein